MGSIPFLPFPVSKFQSSIPSLPDEINPNPDPLPFPFPEFCLFFPEYFTFFFPEYFPLFSRIFPVLFPDNSRVFPEYFPNFFNPDWEGKESGLKKVGKYSIPFPSLPQLNIDRGS